MRSQTTARITRRYESSPLMDCSIHAEHTDHQLVHREQANELSETLACHLHRLQMKHVANECLPNLHATYIHSHEPVGDSLLQHNTGHYTSLMTSRLFDCGNILIA
jgi:hypothetical protein